MPPKKTEQPHLQAVVLCDSYETRFFPLTQDRPRCLLPLANTPLIEYTLEFLVSAKVSEVFLMCCSHSDQVSEYMKNSKWSTSYVPFKLTTIELPNSSSVGDALRDLDSRSLIKSDFILISGDVICYTDFTEVWRAHQERRQKDKNCIMSIVLRKGAAVHRTRPLMTGFYVVEPTTSQIISYKESVNCKSIGIEMGDLQQHKSLSIRNDLIDCHIDICALDVLALFQENFDYDHLRKDFVSGILTSDLLGKTIYAHILDNDYAARVESFRTYASVSKDIISRYTYPLVVDANQMSDQTYTYQNGHIYKEKDVVLSQLSIIGRDTVIGANTFVGNNTEVSSSVLGRDCKIGENVVIKESHIWNGVTIGDNCVIEKSLVAENTEIKRCVHLRPGTIVGFNYLVEDGTVTECNSLLYNNDSTDLSDASTENIDLNALTSQMEDVYLSDDSILSSKNVFPEHVIKRTRKSSRSLSTTSALSFIEEDEDDFFKEAVASINRSIMDNHSQEVAILELNTLRMTMNASHDKVQSAAIHSLISHIGHVVTYTDVKTASVNVFKTWTPLISRITFDHAGQVQLCQFIEEESINRLHGDRILFYAISTLYDQDVLPEEAIFDWWKQPAPAAKTRQIIAKWIEWLQNAEEESESEEEDDEVET